MDQLRFDVAGAEKSLVWASVARVLTSASIKSARVIEIGVGSRAVSAVFAKHGASATVLDYSERSLAVYKALFESLELSRESLLSNSPASLLY